jgi:hypothetical protein
VSIAEGSPDEGEGCPLGRPCGGREGLRDVCAALLVHAGLQLATTDGRNRMLHVLSNEWRAAVGRALAMAQHPVGWNLVDRPERVAHLADRMDAAYRERRRRDP